MAIVGLGLKLCPLLISSVLNRSNLKKSLPHVSKWDVVRRKYEINIHCDNYSSLEIPTKTNCWSICFKNMKKD